jgi:hypothetical protein
VQIRRAIAELACREGSETSVNRNGARWPMNAAIYARKSTERTRVTEENRSVTRQKQSALKFAVERVDRGGGV